MTDEQRFVWEHREDDPAKLALSAKKYPGLPVAHLARQIDALHKIRRKIPSWYLAGLEFPVAVSLEQASSEAAARFKAALFSGSVMADLTGGLGVDTSFFFGQFAQVHYVEKVAEIFNAARHNLGVLGIENVRFIQDSAENFLSGTADQFDLLYLDPARRDDRKGKVFQLADCTPNVLEIKDLMLEKSPRVLLKTAPLLDIRQAVQQLKNVSKIWVLEYEGDCREVLYLLEKDAPAHSDIPVIAVSLTQSGAIAHSFAFELGAEQLTEATFGMPAGFLYEPMPSILKAGAFKMFSKEFSVSKLHPNTHLYSAAHLLPGLPARSFRIEAVCKYDKKAVTAYVPGGKANVTTRNFPDNTAQVRKKLGLKDGGDTYLFACTNKDGEKIVVICTKA